MIISHRHRFIFLAVPKTGSQSVRAALRPHLGPGDWEQADWRTDRRLPVEELAAVGHGHLSVRETAPHLDPDVWSDYLKFAFVRHPWDRFLSAAWYWNGDRPLFRERTGACLPLLLRSPDVMESLHFRPQRTFLTDDAGEVAVDVVYRYERLENDLHDLGRRLGLGPLHPPRLNPSRRPASDPEDHELRAEVTRHYEADFGAFGYDA